MVMRSELASSTCRPRPRALRSLRTQRQPSEQAGDLRVVLFEMTGSCQMSLWLAMVVRRANMLWPTTLQA